MNGMLILIIAVVVLILGYIFYGGWLARQWGIDPKRPTPAHEFEDGDDYVPAPPYMVLGHHFSSIAGAGPINGPIQAAMFGWVPVLLWVLIGGIFLGAVHDFGALFASLRNKGRTISVVIAENIDDTARKIFAAFSYVVLILVVAAFSSIVANTFASTAEKVNIANEQTASVSLLFIIAAVFWGFTLHGRKLPAIINIGVSLLIIGAVVTAGFLWHPIQLGYTQWMYVVAVYILIASVTPVWILLQPRDYLSSYLLYGLMLLAIFGILGAGFVGALSHLDIPAFGGFVVKNTAIDPETGRALLENGKPVINKAAQGGFLFPALFVTIACGAISGFHSLVSSGTTSKQLDKESQAQAIGYGSMLIECLLAVISLIAVAFVWTKYQSGGYGAPPAIFADGLSQMIATIPGLANAQGITYTLLILAVSVFCLTSLDTATRIARYMFQEFWVPDSSKQYPAYKKFLANKYVATIITVVLGVSLGMNGYTLIWPLFGAANQLLAAVALLAVCVWLGNAGKNNKMFYIP
ncbi:MAG: carbon starvation protein A, partial [Neisseriaceae bacterium]|nr:carbon starvation protein A [Neisseriaceae bacterium]